MHWTNSRDAHNWQLAGSLRLRKWSFAGQAAGSIVKVIPQQLCDSWVLVMVGIICFLLHFLIFCTIHPRFRVQEQRPDRSWLFIAAADLSLLLVSSWLYLIIQIHLDPPASLSSEEYHGLSLLPWPLCLLTDWVWVNSSINCFPLTVNSDVHSFNWKYWWNMDCVPATVVDVEGAVRNQRIKSHPHGAYIIVGYSHCPTITKYT